MENVNCAPVWVVHVVYFRSSHVVSIFECIFLSDFVASGLEWNTTTVVFYADGVAYASLPAQCLSQPIGLDFDRETMPGNGCTLIALARCRR